MPKFNNVKVWIINVGPFKRGAAMALPGIGIFIGRTYAHDQALLRHEFGHILQARKWGLFFFYTKVAISSLISAWKKPSMHNFHWTEWTANYLSYNYFHTENTFWNHFAYPIAPPKQNEELSVASFPHFCKNEVDFYAHYLQDDHLDSSRDHQA